MAALRGQLGSEQLACMLGIVKLVPGTAIYLQQDVLVTGTQAAQGGAEHQEVHR